MISFYPGPSQVYPQISEYFQDALSLNISGYNHRSVLFVDLIKQLKNDLFAKLLVPQDYELGFVSSATEMWGVLSNSFQSVDSTICFNGSFGQKWHYIQSQLNPNSKALKFGVNEVLPFEQIKTTTTQLIGICQNETSNGTQVSNQIIEKIRSSNPNALIAVDATSSMAGVHLDFKQADIWFASVQKCFGLPAGLCVVLMSLKVKEYLPMISKLQYNNLAELYKYASECQTIHTPNTLNIYLLHRLMQSLDSIESIHAETITKAQQWRSFLNNQNLSLLPQNNLVLSDTVLAISYPEEKIKHLLESVHHQGFMLGKGYGEFAKNTFRIANFPAINKNQIADLQKVLNF